MELCKNDQKKDTKNITSEMMNKSIPIFNPKLTTTTCSPSRQDSRLTSRHQKKALTDVTNIEISKGSNNPLLNITRADDIMFNKQNPTTKGHGLTATK
jgi:hypothetical protein